MVQIIKNVLYGTLRGIKVIYYVLKKGGGSKPSKQLQIEMKKKWIAVLFATLIIVGGLLTGCQSNKPVQDSPVVNPEETAPTSQAPALPSSSSQPTAMPQQSQPSTQVPENGITQDQAKQIALQDAGVTEADISGLRVKLDRDDGFMVYEVQFYVQNKEYDYEIDAASGAILSSDFDVEDDFIGGNAQAGQIISQEDATKAALERVEGATNQDIRIHLDYDDGRQVYEGDIYYNNIEYEFKIDASTGKFLEWSQETR